MQSRFGVYAFLCAGAAAILASPFANTQAQAQELKEFNILLPSNTSCTIYPVHVANELGFFAKEGLKVNLLASNTTVPPIAFLSNAEADLVMLDSAQVLQAADSKQPVSTVYEAMQYAPEGIVVQSDSPVVDLNGLKGKTVGLASDRDQVTTAMALASVGLDISDVNTVVVGQVGPVMAKAFRDNAIDAFAGGSSVRSDLTAAGINIRNITPFELSDNPGNNWSLWNDRKDEIRPLVEGFLRAYAMGQLAGTIDSKAVMSMCRKVIPEEWEKVDVATRSMQEKIYSINIRRGVLFGDLRPWVWERIQGQYIQVGEINAEVDPEAFLDDSFLAAANDFTTREVAEAIIDWKQANASILLP